MRENERKLWKACVHRIVVKWSTFCLCIAQCRGPYFVVAVSHRHFQFRFLCFFEFSYFYSNFHKFRRCLETIKSREAASSWRETNSRCESKNSRKNWNFDVFQVQGRQGEGEKEQGQQGERSRPGHDWSWSVLKKDEVQFLKSCPWKVLPAAFFINIISSSNFWNLQEAKILTFNFKYVRSGAEI